MVLGANWPNVPATATRRLRSLSLRTLAIVSNSESETTPILPRTPAAIARVLACAFPESRFKSNGTAGCANRPNDPKATRARKVSLFPAEDPEAALIRIGTACACPGSTAASVSAACI